MMTFVASFYNWNGGNSLIYDINEPRQNVFLAYSSKYVSTDCIISILSKHCENKDGLK